MKRELVKWREENSTLSTQLDDEVKILCSLLKEDLCWLEID